MNGCTSAPRTQVESIEPDHHLGGGDEPANLAAIRARRQASRSGNQVVAMPGGSSAIGFRARERVGGVC